MFGTSVKEGDVYKFVLSTTTKRFYSDNNEFGVYDFITEDDIPVEDNAVPMLFGNDEKRINRGVIAGTTGELENGIYYDVEAEVVYNQKFDSWQYKPIKIIPLVPTDIDKSRKFLQSVITKAQTDALLNKYPDIIDKIMNGDKIDLKNIKGVKDKSFVKIEEKIKKTYGMMDLVVFLRPLGVTIKTIEKLFKSGTSSSVIKKKLIENPYILTRIDGFGFKRADEIALKIAPHIVCSEFRTQSFMVNLLNDVANQYGHTWVNTGKFLEECRRNIPECKNYVMATLENGSNSIFYIDKETKRIALQKNRRLESNISQELKRLLSGNDEFIYNDVSKTISNIERLQGWDFTDEQLDGVQLIQDNNVIAVTGGAGCVDADTEFFDGRRWKRIADYEVGDMVLQYNHYFKERDGCVNTSLVSPSEYHKYPCENLWHFETKYGLDQCLSDEHNVFYVTSKNNLYSKSFKEVRENHENTGFKGKFITTFNYSGKGIDLTDEEIRVMVAVIGDGSFYSKSRPGLEGYRTCRLHIKKKRKKDRLRKLFKDAELEWREAESVSEGYTDFYIQAPRREKEFSSYWYDCSQAQLQVVCDEVLHWDGSFRGGRRAFSTTIKETADFVQFAFSACGMRASINISDRRGTKKIHLDGKVYERKSIEYELCITDRILIGLCTDKRESHTKTPITPYKTTDGYKYCFTVNSGMLVLRRNNKIFITGNSGKTSVATAMTKILENYSVVQVALSGRAALRIKNVTGVDSSTIHRLLKLKDGAFVYNENNKLPHDVIVIDEASMIGASLFNSLLCAIKTDAKLIVMGDVDQLDSIGVGSVFKDMLDSGVIPKVSLTKVHRQAQRSAILMESINIKKQKQIFNKEFYGKKTLGELQDLTLDIHEDSEDLPDKIISYFKQEYERVQDIMDVQVIVSMRERGESSVYALNNRIQAIVNPRRTNKSEIELSLKSGNKYIIREGDKVINRKNHYGIPDVNDIETDIFNGNIGIVKELADTYMVVEFIGIGEVMIDKSKWKNIELGYVSTTHSYQGEQSKSIIVGLDMSAYAMLSKEWLYTAITRAMEQCILVAENRAVQMSISQSKTSVKMTFLKEFLANDMDKL